VDAEVTLIETRRQLEQRRAQIDQELALLGESVQLGVEQVAITAQRYEMSIAAFEVGEIDLTQVVIAQQQATQARMDLETLRLRRQRISSEYNQIIGVLP
jgi:outer membrane protein TolC